MNQDNKDYLRHFAIAIPQDIVRRDDGTPAICATHKQEFIDYFKSIGRYDELEKMSWADRDKEYLKWENGIKNEK